MSQIKKIIKLFFAIRQHWSNISIIRTISYSLRNPGIILVGKSILSGGGRIITNPNSYVLLGVEGTTNVPIQLINEGNIEFLGYVSLYKGTKCVVAKNGYLRIGDGTYINEYTRIFTYHKIFIGSGCAISWNVVIADTDVHKIFKNDTHVNPNRSVEIADNVWIGFNSTITKGTIIKNNTIIGSNSFVHGQIEGNNIYYGNPLKSVEFDKWL